MALPNIVSSIFSIPSSWLASPAAILTNLVIPFLVIWFGVYFFLREMRMFGYGEGVYVILGLLVSIVSVGWFKLGVIGGVIGAVALAFSLKYTGLLVKLLIVGGYAVLVFVVIPYLLH